MKKGAVNISKKQGKHVAIIQLSVLLLIVPLLFSCTKEPVSGSRFVLGTYATITINNPPSDNILTESFDLLYAIDHEISRYTEGSWVYRINEMAGKEAVSVPPEIYSLIKRAFSMAEVTDGIFNPAIGPLSSLWALGTERAKVPTDAEIEEVLPLLDWRLVELNDEAMSVYLPLSGMSLDLGGVGKGYAADALRNFLVKKGVKSALLNLGGSITVIGDKIGRPWRIGIQRPFGSASETFTVLELEDTSLVTSGGYQRYIERDGVLYHHILSSQTGYPYETDLLSASVITEDATLGDMLSTVFFALGRDEALKAAEQFGVKAVLLDEELEISVFDAEKGKVGVE